MWWLIKTLHRIFDMTMNTLGIIWWIGLRLLIICGLWAENIKTVTRMLLTTTSISRRSCLNNHGRWKEDMMMTKCSDYNLEARHSTTQWILCKGRMKMWGKYVFQQFKVFWIMVSGCGCPPPEEWCIVLFPILISKFMSKFITKVLDYVLNMKQKMNSNSLQEKAIFWFLAL